jgi:Tol biopolymer transport system component
MRRVLGLAGALAVAILIAAAPAHATFPGKNGKLAVDHTNYNTCCFVGDDYEWGLRDISFFTMNPDGSGRTVIAEDNQAKALWSPDGTRLAWLTRVPTQCCYWDNGITVARADGSQSREIIDTNLRLHLYGWSPDGRWLLYDGRQKNCRNHVFAVNANSGQLVQFSEGPACSASDPPEPATDDWGGAWSPDGSRVVFFREPGLWIANADGTHQGLLVPASSGTSLGPLASGIGPAIAFGTYRNEEMGIDAVDWDGSNRRVLLAPRPGSITDLSWSPDGKRLLFVHDDRRDAPNVLYRVNADGSGLIEVARSVFEPAWSPDSRLIAFTALDPNHPRPPNGSGYDARAVFVINADGTGRMQVTTTPDSDFVSDWQPLPAPRRSDYENASKFCKAEQDYWADQFASRYGGGKNAHGRCVSGK